MLSISRVRLQLSVLGYMPVKADMTLAVSILYPGIQAVNVLFNAVKLGALTWKTAMDSCTDNTDS